jgi:hypothetical protein
MEMKRLPRHAWPIRICADRRFWLFMALLALFGWRVWAAFTLRVNSDEPQHLHIVWCWTQGILPYRDVFDNHAPLFHILYAPLLSLLGERADIVPWMRLAVVPWYALTLWLAYLLGTRLYDQRMGLIATALVALQPTFFARSVEFRPDDAWAAAWMAAMVVAVSGRPTPRRAFGCGLLGGLAAAFSIKSAILIAAAVVAAALVLSGWTLLQRKVDWMRTIRVAAATALGGAILPTVILATFIAAGAGTAIYYCLLVHNSAAGLGRWSHVSSPVLAFPLMLPSIVACACWVLRRARDPMRSALRLWVMSTALLYLALRASYQPLLDKQDLLPLIPMLAPFAAALLVNWAAWRGPGRQFAAGVTLTLALELVLSLKATCPWQNEARAYAEELRTLLLLSQPNDTVMDDKAESIYRTRASYWVLENVTLYRLAHGLIPDDIVDDLIGSRVGIGIFDRERGSDQEFVRANYLPIAPNIEVAGKLLGFVSPNDTIDFKIEIPQQYAVVARHGPASGMLDGTPYASPRLLAAGPHRFVPARPDEWALELASAMRKGYSPFGVARAEHARDTDEQLE